jgi:hypothetical protein
MTPEEHTQKVLQAASVGHPVFLPTDEITFAIELLTRWARESGNRHKTEQKIDKLRTEQIIDKLRTALGEDQADYNDESL